ncbi:MAG: serine hydrolase domain-containing protein [Blastocatellia bacterium]
MKRALFLTALGVALMLCAQPRVTGWSPLPATQELATSGCRGLEFAVDVPKAKAVDKMLRTKWEKPNSPGAAVAVMQGGKIRFLSGYGLSDIGRHTAISEKTVFNLASVSKQFTAMAIMKLVEQGRLRLDERLPSLLPEFKPFRATEQITVRHLLTHTSGLPDYLASFGDHGQFLKRGFVPKNQDVINELARKTRLRFTPGTNHIYSNSGYVVLSEIVRRRSGTSFAAFLKTNFFDPLAMTQTFVKDNPSTVFPNQARAYQKTSRGFTDVTTSQLDSIYGDGNVFSTICDLSTWLEALLEIFNEGHPPLNNSVIGRDSRKHVVRQDTLKQVFSQVVVMQHGEESIFTYGFGWRVLQNSDIAKGSNDSTLEAVLHTGKWWGVRTFIGILPNRGNGLIGILLSNNGNFTPCEEAGKIARMYLKDVPGIRTFIDCRGLD